MSTELRRGEHRAKRDDRETRVPVSGNRNILTVDGKEEGFMYRWVKDIGNRIKRFERAGYEVVKHDVTVGDARAAVASEPGAAVTAFGNKEGEKLVLMRIRQEYYDEDQAAKMAEIDAIEAAMGKNVEGSYGDIKISR